MSKKQEQTKFICPRYPSFKIVVKPRYVEYKDGISYPKAGKQVQFQNGLVITSDPDIINKVRKHNWFGSHITEVTAKDEARIKQRNALRAKAEKEISAEMAKFDAEEEKKSGSKDDKADDKD